MDGGACFFPPNEEVAALYVTAQKTLLTRGLFEAGLSYMSDDDLSTMLSESLGREVEFSKGELGSENIGGEDALVLRASITLEGEEHELLCYIFFPKGHSLFLCMIGDYEREFSSVLSSVEIK